jgi:hypothetical protein
MNNAVAEYFALECDLIRSFVVFLIYLSIVLNPVEAMAVFGSSSFCICQTGDNPGNQVLFFQAGCVLWLAANRCIGGSIQPVSEKITLPSKTRHLYVGYVGHWGSSEELVSYLDQFISPILSRGLESVYIDNTACFAMDNPTLVLNWLSSARKNFSGKIEIVGNQTLSIGMWQPMYWGKANFSAKVVSNIEHAQYPACVIYENQRCVGTLRIQEGETGLCTDANGRTRRLMCTPREFVHYYTDEFGQPNSWTEVMHVWSAK